MQRSFDNALWAGLMQTARERLVRDLTANPLGAQIGLLIEPSFDDSVLIRFEFDDRIVRWFRTTWMRSTDAEKLGDPIGSLKYIGRQLQPTIVNEHGTTGTENLSGALQFIQRMAAPPLFVRERLVIDGTSYMLRIVTGCNSATYTWCHLPDAWADLQTLADMMVSLAEAFAET